MFIHVYICICISVCACVCLCVYVNIHIFIYESFDIVLSSWCQNSVITQLDPQDAPSSVQPFRLCFIYEVHPIFCRIIVFSFFPPIKQYRLPKKARSSHTCLNKDHLSLAICTTNKLIFLFNHLRVCLVFCDYPWYSQESSLKTKFKSINTVSWSIIGKLKKSIWQLQPMTTKL